MSWSEFWNKPEFSVGGVMFFLFVIWIVRSWEKYYEDRAEAIRRHQEKYGYFGRED